MNSCRNTVKFCFWDEFATSFDSEKKQQNEKPIIVIVSSCRYNVFKGMIMRSFLQLHDVSLTTTTFTPNHDLLLIEFY